MKNSGDTILTRPRPTVHGPTLRRRFSGFTLIELILVLALIAIITGIVVPSFDKFSQGRGIGDASEQMLSAARWARAHAISRGVNFRLNFDTGKQTFWLTQQNGPSFENILPTEQGTASGQTTFDNVNEEFGRTFTTPQGVSFTCSLAQQADGTYVEFRPTGRVDPATIKFVDSGGRSIDVGSLSATENFHVFSDDERQQEQSQPQLPPAQSR